jgi:D-alanine-D-alanine ligase-like ATP-grasp enzyme
MATIKTIPGMLEFLQANERPIVFFGYSSHHLLGIDYWVGGFHFVCRLDCFDGSHPKVYAPPQAVRDNSPGTEEQVVNDLLGHPDVARHVRSLGSRPAGLFLKFDETSEALCDELGIDIWFPPASLRSCCDDKCETVRIGNRAGVPSVPNVISRVDSYETLLSVAGGARLGDDLVVQTAFGEAGHGTCFVANRRDWEAHAAAISGEPEVKVMKRIDPLGLTIEGCVTRCGTLIGPLLIDIVGQKEITPAENCWCGNEVCSSAVDAATRATASDYAVRFGDELHKMGYRGYFGLDLLMNRDGGEIYLGEANPRIGGAGAVTYRACASNGLPPLFLFHLLEYSGADFDLDVDSLNDRWRTGELAEGWSEIVVGSPGDASGVVSVAPGTGLWKLDEAGAAVFAGPDLFGLDVGSQDEGYFLRITAPGDRLYRGVGLGILLTRGRLLGDDGVLNERARAWLAGLESRYRVTAAV